MEQYAHEFFGDSDFRANIPRGTSRPPRPGGGGGRGSGDKSNVGRKSNATRDDAHYVEYGIAKARRESALADIAEMDAAEKAGELVQRAAVRDASAAAFATISQTMRSIPDTLERQLALAPDVAEKIGVLIDEMLDGLADDLERMHKDGAG